MTSNLLKLAAGTSLALMVAACDAQPYRSDPGKFDPLVSKPAMSETIRSEQFRSWSTSDRAAFLAGRVIAADMLFRAGEIEAAAAQLSGLSQQIGSVEDGKLQSLGFLPARIEALSAALELGRPEEEIAERFADAEANLSDVLSASGAEPAEVVAFLMRQAAEAYDLGVRYGDVIDAGAYQAAYGFAVTARDLISPLDEAVYGDLRLELDILVLMWPAAGPLPDRTPPPEVRMAEQFARVKLALATLP
ncbi:MAG: hypothetical protein CVT79_12945 [Alphaproteobacteria bacterium HGW-Alphaproteobacteria-18]|nr:MAG: hypothetical protein CVT79_12945 [Alphaproteobacteria bacterium HGW-Alphaproteobacteria-18]